MIKKAFTTHEIGNYCEVAPRTVVQWINDGKLKAYRTPGNHSRVKVQDFIKFLQEYNIPIPEELKGADKEDGKYKILIVDDDKNMALSINRVLGISDNYQLELAFDGFDAGRKAVGFNPDLVILDIKMPGLDGYAVTKKIKEIPELSQTKIIAMSAFFDEAGKKKILDLGANVCLDKPFKKEDLIREVSELLG